jgi:TRAP-type C4-dicarboxylate transport system substrate-binding protein
MKTRFFIITAVLLTTALFQVNAVTFKLASLLPSGTVWDKSLNKMAADWQDISDGRVKIKIYPGGIAGGEADVVRKMRIGQIDMAVLTAIGMTTIVPDSFAMSLPFMIDSEAELDYILEDITSIFDGAFLDEGFIVLTWSKTGWIKFFSRETIVEPADMMKMKFAGSVTQPELTNAFKKMGFNMISMDIPDTLMALQSGMIDAFYTAPMLAASYQWFAIADNMLNMKVSPVLGGILITERAWRKVPEIYRKEMIEAAMDMSVNFYEEALVLENKAIAVMKDNGLTINEPAEDTRGNWRNLLGEDFSLIVGDGGLVSVESYKKVTSMLDDFRKR